MGARAAAGADHVIDVDAQIKGLALDFLCTGHITGRAQRGGTAAGNDIGFAALAGDLVCDLLHGCHHVGAAGNNRDLFDAQQVEQEIIAPGLGAIAAGHPFF